MIRAETGPTTDSRPSSGVDQDQLGDLDVAGQPGDPVDKLGGVGWTRRRSPRSFIRRPSLLRRSGRRGRRAS